MRVETRRSESGFSLAELLVAMTITLIISSSIYLLLGQGQSSFRREPAVSDRQQQVRVAMDLIQRDVAVAGMGMTEWVQAFSRIDFQTGNSLNAFGPTTNAAGDRADVLEIYGTDHDCQSMPVCGDASGVNVDTYEGFPSCYQFPQLVMLTPGRGGAGTSIGWGHNNRPGVGCGSGDRLNFPPGQPATPASIQWNPPPGQVPLGPSKLSLLQIFRYQIAFEPTEPGVPNLYRSTMGGLDDNNAFTAPPGAGWTMIARGIEDLQVQFRDGTGAWVDVPQNVPAAAAASNYAALVREVRVTVTARMTAQNQGTMQGVNTTTVGGVNAQRGSLVTVTSPRAALIALNTLPTTNPQRWQ